MKDILPGETGTWDHLERLARRLFQTYHYEEIRTPLVEKTALFVRGIGETSDIVSKQMYTFPDRKGRSLTLRPEGTAPVIRAYLEHGLHRQGSLRKLFYTGSFFRSERPQAGRGREFHQIGAEAIGCASPALDTEVIALAIHLLQAFGLNGLRTNLNSIGCPSCQPAYREILRKDLKANADDSLCSDCQDRMEKNPLRVLDCKRKGCQPLIEKSPSISDYLCSPCAEHFHRVQVYLKELGIECCLDPHLVRGLDYYTRTAFEITHEHLGSQNTLAAGGRFDGLVKEMGGTPTPAVGFALGMERVILARGKLKATAHPLSVYLAPQGEEAGRETVKLLHRLRGEGINGDMDYEDRSLKSQLRLANRMLAKYVVIVAKRGTVLLKDMQSGQQEELETELVVERLKRDLNF